MPAPFTRRVAVVLAFAASALPGAALSAQPTADLTEQSAISRRPLLRAFRPLVTAAWSQTLGSPDAWPRTWGGYGSRAADQYGVLLVRSTVHYAVDRAVPWVDDRSPCVAHPVSWARQAVSRASCAVVRTSTLQTAGGSRRPNLPLLSGIVVGAATSLSWRPERQSAAEGRAFVAQRIATSYGAAVLIRVLKDRRADTTPRR